MLASVEVCAGAGGQALGLEQAGFRHEALVEIDPWACATLRHNRPEWKVREEDVGLFDGGPFAGIDLLSGGVPCPPFSVAGKQLGHDDERDLFPQMLRLAREIRPRALLIENVRGLLDPRFDRYRAAITAAVTAEDIGLVPQGWQLLKASEYGVPQLRPRVAFVAIHADCADRFRWPPPSMEPPPSVGEALYELMAANGWEGARAWAERAKGIAPTLVGGSRKHGGPDLGPTRARRQWLALGVEGRTLAEAAPPLDFAGMPRLTVRMIAALQGFPPEWEFVGRKTAAGRQVGNAFPPPVARALGKAIKKALNDQN